MEGLKTELKSSRNAQAQLQKQVKRLKSAVRVHLPSVAVGVVVGVLVQSLFRVFCRGKAATAEPKEATPEEAATVVATAAAEE